MKSVYIKRSVDLELYLLMQPSKFFSFLIVMRIKPFTLLKILFLLASIDRQYQLELKYKHPIELGTGRSSYLGIEAAIIIDITKRLVT